MNNYLFRLQFQKLGQVYWDDDSYSYSGDWDSWDYSGDDDFEDYEREDYEARLITIYAIGIVVGLVIIGVLIFCICQECLLNHLQHLLYNNFPNIKRPQSRTTHLQ